MKKLKAGHSPFKPTCVLISPKKCVWFFFWFQVKVGQAWAELTWQLKQTNWNEANITEQNSKPRRLISN